jgi:ribosomal protein L11 methyltransferase
MNTENPFKQNPLTYCVKLQTKFLYLEKFIEFCEIFSNSVSYFEAEDTKDIDNKPEDLWQIEMFFEEMPNMQELSEKFIKFCNASLIETSDLSITKVDDKDWVSEVQKTFTPIQAGKFFIHHSHHKIEVPQGTINIEINAGRAFGTGEHETTSNCLKSLSELKYLGSCLDMGCGSGILAIAMAKLDADKVIAVDLDEQAILVTKENIILNNVDILLSQSDGYEAEIIELHAPYDTITANILANPLIEMSAHAYKNLKIGGKLIIAGFIKQQTERVLKAHVEQGFILEKQICLENWPALILTKI